MNGEMEREKIEIEPRDYIGFIDVVCPQQFALQLLTLVTPQCQINSRTCGSSAVLYQEDPINGTSRLQRESNSTAPNEDGRVKQSYMYGRFWRE